MKRTTIGSISSGTMRPEDLIPSFVWEADHNRLSRENRNTLRAIKARYGSEGYYDSEESGWDIEELFDILNDVAPPYFYFGAHPGDGAEYGFWLSESFQEDFDGPQLSDLADLPAGYVGEFVVVNDHGNVSLYTRSRNGHVREIWAVV